MMRAYWTDRLILAAGAVISALTLQDYLAQWVDTGGFLGRYSPRLGLVLALVLAGGLLALVGLALSFTPLWRRLAAPADKLAAGLRRLGPLPARLSLLLWLALPALFLVTPWNLLLFASLNARLWAAWLIGLVQVLLWRGRWPRLAVFNVSLLACGLLMLLFNFRNDLSASPFSLAWSEGSRFYNASLWNARAVYGLALPLPELHPTRYLLQSLAFLLPGADIAFHRAWQVFLWIACNALAAWALTRRLQGATEKAPPPTPPAASATRRGAEEGRQSNAVFGARMRAPKTAFVRLPSPFQGEGSGVRVDAGSPTTSLREGGRGDRWLFPLFALWAFLFFFMGPVYYHLILCAALVLWGFDRKRFWRSLVVVIAASLWAGISRINWYPLPGLLAALLYLLEEPLNGRPFWRYLARPAAWALAGVGAALLANAAYVRFSGNPPEVFGSALNSPLLWYRLLPNATYGPGVLLASLMLLPVGAALAWGLLRAWRAGARWHILRLLELAGILAVFLGGGLLVSIKVGGGSNLHNLDSLIVLLAVAAGYIFFQRFTPDRAAAQLPVLPRWLVLVNVALVLISAAGLLNLEPRPAPKMSEAQALQWLQGLIDRYSQDERPVLMITERQLLSFHQIKLKSFEPSYEKVFLMEMAMSGNPAYLAKYFNDIKQRKFSLIITEPMNMHIQQEEQFSEENNYWVRRIEEPTVGRYELVGKLDDYPIAVYAPIPVKP